MKLVRLTEGAQGVSHFSDEEIAMTMGDFAPPAPSMWMSATEPVQNLLYLTLPAGWGGAKHPSPRKQIGFLLSGRVRVEAGDGETREMGAGGIWRMEDTRGSGHTTTIVGDDDVRMAIVQLE